MQKQKEKYYIVGTVLKSNRKIVERGKIDTQSKQIHDRALSCIGTDTLIKSGGCNTYYIICYLNVKI